MRRGRRGGFDRDAYRRRNAVERDWSRLKQWRGIAARYDRTATDYRGGILLAVLLTWTPNMIPETGPSGRGCRVA